MEPVLHSYDGEICGGTPDTTLVAKLISKFRVEFEEDDDVFTWIQKRKQFMNELRCTMPAATMYTMVSVFTLRAWKLAKIYEPMLENAGKYNSMEHFLREVEKERYPNPGQAAYVKFSTRQQLPGESVRQYWIEFRDLAGMVKMDATQHAIRFIDGMLQEDIRTQSRVRWSDGDGDIERILSLADGMERAKKAEEERRKLRKGATAAATASTKVSSSASVSAASTTTPKKGGKPTPPPKPQQQQQSPQPQQPQQQQQQQPRSKNKTRNKLARLEEENSKLALQIAAIGLPAAVASTATSSAASTATATSSASLDQRLQNLATS